MVRRFTTVSATAAVLAVHSPYVAADAGMPTIDQIFSGSAAPGTVAPSDAQSGGQELGLGSGLASGPGRSAAPTGSSAGVVPNPAGGQALGLGPSTPSGIDTARVDPAPGTAPATEIAAPDTLGGLLLPDPDAVLPACVGSAAVGSAALGSGILSGSGLGSSLVGLGSSASVGSGSAGAGSVAVGSAATGSALLTCMLLLPVSDPPEPGSPLIIPLPAPEPAVAPIPVRLPEVIPPTLAAVPPPPTQPPPVEYAAPVQSPPAPALTALQVMTVMIITIIAGARARLRGPK
ncbi:hypothetical protein ACWZHB_00570 [Nocardia sp. FBN12]|uniref:hypothetical protein n=1 Tax=Nocardia sp. FBN12 TaxID=3419766 RepID=UPI003D05681B